MVHFIFFFIFCQVQKFAPGGLKLHLNNKYDHSKVIRIKLVYHRCLFKVIRIFYLKRIEHRIWNRGLNGLHQLGLPVAPSILFPVFNPPYPQGRDPKLGR